MATSIFVGEIRPFAGKKAPAGWLPCDGRALTAAEYPALHEVIGTTFGSTGDGGFRLPSLAGRVAVGTSLGGDAAYALGATGGTETVTLSVPQLPAHGHALLGTLHATTAAGTPAPVGGRFATAPAATYAKPSVPPTDHMADGILTGVTDAAGGPAPHDNMQPSLAVDYYIASTGIKPQNYPPPGPPAPPSPDDQLPYLGQVVLAAFDFLPAQFAPCDGRLLPIEGNKPLFSLLGTSYGGNGQTTFAVPDLRGYLPINRRAEIGPGPRTGAPTVALTLAQLPKHQHAFSGTLQTGDFASDATPALSYPANGDSAQYSAAATDLVDMAENAVTGTATPIGSGQPHENRQPFIALAYILSLGGVFPSRG